MRLFSQRCPRVEACAQAVDPSWNDNLVVSSCGLLTNSGGYKSKTLDV